MMKILFFAILPVLSEAGVLNYFPNITGCGIDVDILMVTHDRGDFFNTTNTTTLRVEDDGNFIVKKDDQIIYQSSCYCYNSPSGCYDNYEIKLQTDGNALVIPKGEENEHKIWKTGVTAKEGTYALLVNHDCNNTLQIWSFDENDQCPDTKIWDASVDDTICCGTTEQPMTQPAATVEPTCDPNKTILIMSDGANRGTEYSNGGFTLSVLDYGNFVVVRDSNDEEIYNNECYCDGVNCNEEVFEIKLRPNGNTFIAPENQSIDESIWKSKSGGDTGVYGLLINGDDSDKVQIWALDDNKCPVTRQWTEESTTSQCVTGVHELPTEPAATVEPTCDQNKVILMVSGDRSTEFSSIDGDYKLSVTEVGNFIVTTDGESTTIFNNGCYCTGNDCDEEFEIWLNDTGQVTVLSKNPDDLTDEVMLWRTQNFGSEGKYALLVDLDGQDQVEIWTLDDKDCPGTKLSDDSSWTLTCSGNDQPPTEPAATVEPTCDPDKSILMFTNDRDTHFEGGDYKLFVTDDGNFVVTKNGRNIIFNNGCYCTGDGCDEEYTIKLQDDGHIIVLPNGKTNDDMLWMSEAVGPIGNYALLVNQNNDEIQIWKLDGSACPETKIWDDSDYNSVCYGAGQPPTIPAVTLPPTCDPYKTILMVSGDRGAFFEEEDFVLTITDEGNLVVMQNWGTVVFNNNCYCSDDVNCNQPLEIMLESNGNAIILPSGGSSGDSLWKSNAEGPEGSYVLLVNALESDEIQIWNVNGEGCPESKLWGASDEMSLCYGNHVTSCEEGKTVLMTTNEEGTYFKKDNYTLTVSDSGNFVVTVNDDIEVFNNGCYYEGTICSISVTIKLQSNGQACVFLFVDDPNNVDKIWNTNGFGVDGFYGLLVNHDEGDEVQIWTLRNGCPANKLWEPSDQSSCYGSNVVPAPTKTILMETDNQGNYFEAGEYTLTVSNAGNFLIADSANNVLYDNYCYCAGDGCKEDGDFHVKLQSDGNMVVIPADGMTEKRLWKSNRDAPEGSFALVVNHDNNEAVEIWKVEGSCFTEKVWDSSGLSSLCYGSWINPDCEDDITVLMETGDAGNSYKVNDYTLQVHDLGDFAVTSSSSDVVVYDNTCYCDRDCKETYKIKLQSDGCAIVLPEDGSSYDRLWESGKSVLQGTYALLVDHNDSELQIWKVENGCPETKVWDPSRESSVCYGSTALPSTPVVTSEETTTPPSGSTDLKSWSFSAFKISLVSTVCLVAI